MDCSVDRLEDMAEKKPECLLGELDRLLSGEHGPLFPGHHLPVHFIGIDMEPIS